MITNNEENFIAAGDDDIRYWVIKVPQLKIENPHFLDLVIEEMPAFLSYLSNRKIVTENRNRMWFHPELLKTEALRKVIQYSRPTIQKEIIYHIREKFLDFGVKEILMSAAAIRKDFFNNKYEANYVQTTLKNDMKVDQYHKLDAEQKDMFGEALKIYVPCRYSYPKWESVAGIEPGKTKMERVQVQEIGRPYIFKREAFLTPEEIAGIRTDAETKFINEISDESVEEGVAAAETKDKGEELPF